MYKLFFLNICCLFLLVACEHANSNSATIQEEAPTERKADGAIMQAPAPTENATDNNADAIQTTDKLVLHFTGPIASFDRINSLKAPKTEDDRTTRFKTMAPAFISQKNCACDQLATIKGMEDGYDYSMLKYEDGYLCDADGDGDQDYLVPIVCRKGDEVSITLAFINDSKDPNFFSIASNNFKEFPDGKGLPDCE